MLIQNVNNLIKSQFTRFALHEVLNDGKQPFLKLSCSLSIDFCQINHILVLSVCSKPFYYQAESQNLIHLHVHVYTAHECNLKEHANGFYS